MCTGMVHPEMVFHALDKGADGVMIIGCHLGECHYIKGNEMALARSEVIMPTPWKTWGMKASVFKVAWVSSAEPERLAEAFREMSARLAVLRGSVQAGPETRG